MWILFLVCAVVVLGWVRPVYLQGAFRHRPVLEAAVKASGTLLACGLALVGAARFPDGASRWIAAGLMLCAIADALLNFHFLTGTLAFLGAHLCYIRAFLHMAPLRPFSAALFFFLYLFALVFLAGYQKPRGAHLPYLLYGGVLVAMLAIALLLPGQTGLRGVWAAVGAMLFAVSDLLIAKQALSGPLKTPASIMTLYYMGQLSLALVALQPWLHH